MTLSIIIVSFNSLEYLRNCLHSLYQTISKISFEIIVVDNASKDGTVKMLQKEFPAVKLIQNKKNLGFAKANNQGIKISKGRYILLLNPDTQVLPKSIEYLFDFMEKNPKIGIAGPRIINSDGSLQFSIGFFPTLWDIFLEYFLLLPLKKRLVKKSLERLHQNPTQADFLLGACLFIKREVFDKIGLLDEQFFLYSEEVDFCKRAKETGLGIYYFPRASIVHHLSKSTSGSANLMKRIKSRIHLQESHFKFFRKHSNFLTAHLVKLIISFSLFLRWFIFTLKRPFVGPNLKRELELKIEGYKEVLNCFWGLW